MTNLIGMVVPANLFYSNESAGGKLTFTEVGLEFKPHLINLHHKITMIPYNQVADVQKKSTLGVVPNGVLVTTKSGQSYNFVVTGRSAIIEFLNSMKS